MAKDIESILVQARRVEQLREAVRSPEKAVAIVKKMLEVEEAALIGAPRATNGAKPRKPATGPVSKPTAAKKGATPLSERIRSAMKDGKQHTTADIAGTLKVDREQVGDAMKRMEARTGELKRISPGVYALATGKKKSKKK